MRRRIFIFCIFLGILTGFLNIKESIGKDIWYLQSTVEHESKDLKNYIDDVERAVENLKY